MPIDHREYFDFEALHGGTGPTHSWPETFPTLNATGGDLACVNAPVDTPGFIMHPEADTWDLCGAPLLSDYAEINIPEILNPSSITLKWFAYDEELTPGVFTFADYYNLIVGRVNGDGTIDVSDHEEWYGGGYRTPNPYNTTTYVDPIAEQIPTPVGTISGTEIFFTLPVDSTTDYSESALNCNVDYAWCVRPLIWDGTIATFRQRSPWRYFRIRTEIPPSTLFGPSAFYSGAGSTTKLHIKLSELNIDAPASVTGEGILLGLLQFLNKHYNPTRCYEPYDIRVVELNFPHHISPVWRGGAPRDNTRYELFVYQRLDDNVLTPP